MGESRSVINFLCCRNGSIMIFRSICKLIQGGNKVLVSYGKTLLSVLAVVVQLVLAGCGPNNTAAPATAEPARGESTTAVAQEDTSKGNTARLISKSPYVEAVTFHSEALDQEMALNVYLPPSYDGEQAFPVLYMLHGFTGSQNDWVPYLGADKTADQLIKAGDIDPVIIVSIQYNNSYGLNTSDRTELPCPQCMHNGRYQDYLSQDVIRYIDSNYKTNATKEARYIGGLSMGGFAALYTAFTNPELFSKVGGHSPAVWLDDWTMAMGLDQWLYPNEEVRKQRDPIELAKTNELTGLSVYLDCGDDDSYRFFEGAELLNKTLQAEGVPSEFHLNDGAHDVAYWSGQLENYLKFYAGK